MNYFAFTGLLNGLTSISLGLYVLIKDFKNSLNRTYSFFAFGVFFWSFGYFFWQLSRSSENALFWSRFLMAGAILIPVAYFNFSLNLTHDYPKKHFASIVSYIVCIIFLSLNLTPLIVNGISKKLFFNFWPEPGIFYPLFLLMFFSYVFYSLFLMYKNFIHASGHHKAQIRYVFLGTVIGFAGGSTNFFLWYNIPIPPFANILVLAYPILLAYAITKHELMDIRVVISRGMAYGIAGGLLIVSFIGLNAIKMPAVLAMTSNALLALFWAWGAHRLRDVIQTPLEEKWITGWYEPTKVMNSIAEKLVPVLEREEAFRIVAEELKNTIKIKKVDLLNKRECSNTREVKRDGKTVIIPFISSEGLEGGLRLAEKISEDPYDEKDLTLFRTLQVQILAILDRIRPYEKIKEDYEKSLKAAERTARLASLGTLALGVAHEIRNPMSIINLQAEMLPQKIENKEFLLKFAEIIPRNVFRIMEIVNKMLSFGAPKKAEIKLINISRILDDVLALTESKYQKFNIKIAKDYQALPEFGGDPTQIFQIFFNIILNAIEAMEKGGELQIKVQQSGSNLEIQIIDSGCGIPANILDRIYDPFFTTKAEGIGLGLSTAHRIIESYGGKINIQSKEGKGTTVTVTLPRG